MSTLDASVAPPGLFARLALALRVLFDAELAARVAKASSSSSTSAAPQLAPPAPAAGERVVERVVEKEIVVEKVKVDPEAGALHLLAILQRDGRLVDFLQEDLQGASDVDIGAAARIVQAGCKKALAQYVRLEPVNKAAEGSAVVVEAGFNQSELRLSGNVAGQPPYRGKLAHGGWRATSVTLPERPASVDARVVAPAEVEL